VAVNALPRFFRALESAGVIVWLNVAAAWAAMSIVRYGVCLRRLKRSGRRDYPAIQQLAAELSAGLRLRRGPRLLVTLEPVGPAVVGLLRPTVVLPAALVERHGASALAPILAHELIHVRRGDLWVGLLQAVARALWWFHPLVWVATRRITREAERSCDEEVIAALRLAPREYARRLVDVLELKRTLKPFPALAGVRPVDVTSQRLERIMRLEHGCLRRTPWWCWLVMLGASAACLPGAAFIVQAEESATDSNDLAVGAAPDSNPSHVTGADTELSKSPAVRTSIDGGVLSLETVSCQFRIVSGKELELQTNGQETDLRFRDGECEIAMKPANERAESRLALRADEVRLTTRFDPLTGGHVHEMSLAGNALIRRTGQDGAASSMLRAERVELQIVGEEIRVRADGMAEAFSNVELSQQDSEKPRDVVPAEASDKAAAQLEPIEVMGPIIDDDHCTRFGNLSDEEMMKLVAGELTIPCPVGLKDIRIVKRKIADYVDEPRVVPLVGRAKMHHVRYQYTLHVGGKPHSTYVDFQHLHVMEPTAPDAQADHDRADQLGTPDVEPLGVGIGPIDVRRLVLHDSEWQKLLAANDVRRRLRTSIRVQFQDEPLVDALASISELIGLDMNLEEDGLREEQVDARTPVTLQLAHAVSVKSILHLILEPLNLKYVVDGGSVKITSAARARDRVVWVSYYVRDLVFAVPEFVPSTIPHNDKQQQLVEVDLSKAADFDSLAELITTTIAPEHGNRRAAPAPSGNLQRIFVSW
jgi:beta-lactamase regulating signal transducer with metallopeptidase domain